MTRRPQPDPLVRRRVGFSGQTCAMPLGSPVSWDLYQQFGPFPYSGELRAATYTPGEHAPDSPVHMIGMLRDLGRRYE